MVTIREAKKRSEIVKFMKFPLTLYKGETRYIPDVLSSQVDDIDPKKNPAFEYCETKCFLAERDGKIVGRVQAILNTRANEKFGKKYLNFTNLDFIDDDEVVDALFGAVEDYANELNCNAVHGPLGFSDMDREGLLVEGFEHQSLFYTFYNRPYYINQLTRKGYVKQVDWLEYRVDLPSEPDAKLHRMSEYVKKKLHLRAVSLGDFPIKRLMRDVFALWNDTYQVLFGVVAMSDAQMEKYTSEFLPMITKHTTSFVYNEKDELVAFAITCPSIDNAMRSCGGKLAPFGWIPMLRALHGRNDSLDLLLIAVHPELQGAGVNAILLDDLLNKVIAAGYRYAETGPMLETNDRVLAIWKHFNATQHKRRRCFVKEMQ